MKKHNSYIVLSFCNPYNSVISLSTCMRYWQCIYKHHIHRQREARISQRGEKRVFHYAINRQTTTTTTATTLTLLSWGRTLTSAFGSASCWILVFSPRSSSTSRRREMILDIWGSVAPDFEIFKPISSSACKVIVNTGEGKVPKSFPQHIHSGRGRFLLNRKVHTAKSSVCMKAKNS